MMATGPEHYKTAEALAAQAHTQLASYEDDGRDSYREHAEALTALAQVHATLAHAAAVAELERYGDDDGGASLGRHGGRERAWQEAMDGA